MVLDRKIGLVLIALTGFFYALTFSYPPETMSFPRFLLYIFGLLSLLLILFPAVPRKYDYKELFSREKILTLVGAAVYVSLLQVIGFFAASFLFVFLYVWGFERGAILKAILVSLAFAALTYFVFEVMLSVSFPKGFLM